MGRPRKEGMDYFPHDVDASQDEKIEAMRSVYGNDGYAFYFITLERIYRSETGELDLNNDVLFVSLAKKIMVTQNKLKKMIQTSVEIGLFSSENFEKRKILTSDGIKKRLSVINSLRDKWRENKGIEKNILNGKPSGKLMENSGENVVENAIKESKGKESKEKEKERKEKESKEEKEQHAESVRLTRSEFQLLIQKYGPQKTTRLIDELNMYKLANGKEYASDHAAIESWVVKRVDEQDNRVQRTSSPSPAPYMKPQPTHRPQLEIHVQDEAPPTDEEWQQMMELARKMDEYKNNRGGHT